jgi:hypothetical protein
MNRTLLAGLVASVVVGAWLMLRARNEGSLGTDHRAPVSSAPDGEHLSYGQRYDSARANGPLIPSSPDAALASDPEARVDRAARDKMRQRIYEAWGRALPGAPAVANGKASGDDGELDARYVEERIRHDFVPLARGCFNAGEEKNPALEGKLLMTLHIVGSESVGGVVESTEIDEDATIDDPEVLDCVQRSMESLTLPAPKLGGSTTIKVPMRFLQHAPEGGS